MKRNVHPSFENMAIKIMSPTQTNCLQVTAAISTPANSAEPLCYKAMINNTSGVPLKTSWMSCLYFKYIFKAPQRPRSAQSAHLPYGSTFLEGIYFGNRPYFTFTSLSRHFYRSHDTQICIIGGMMKFMSQGTLLTDGNKRLSL